jgi:LysM repeat protein
MRKNLFLCALLLTACVSSGEQSYTGSLQTYLTNTPIHTSTPNVLVIEQTTAPTSTPNVYIIQSGDTFSELAETFSISQDELRAANPDISPNSMPVGGTLLIPDPSAARAAASTPTPVPAPVTQTVCHPTADSGLWCFALVQNNTTDILENVSAQINLIDSNGTTIASKTAGTPIDIIPANSSLPVYVFFPDIQVDVAPQIQILSALQANSSIYLPAVLNNSSAEIKGRTAQLRGQIYLPAESKAATQVWVAAVAYDKNGIVVGVRRWEGGGIQPGGSINFEFAVSSLGGEIDAVEFFVQAR